MIVASLAGLVLIDRTLDEAVSARLEERRAAVETVADALGGTVDAALHRLDSTVARIGPWTGDPGARQLARTEALLSGPDLLGGTLVLIDADGIVRVAAPDAAPLLGQQLRGPAIDRALGGEAAVSAIVAEQDPGGRLRFAVPVGDGSGGTGAAVVSLVDPTTGVIADLLAGPFDDRVRLALVTRAGSVVAGDDGVRVVTGDDPNTQVPSEGAAGGTVEAYRGEADTVMTAAHAPVRPGWRLVAYEPYDTFRSQLRSPFWIAAGVLTVVAVMAVAGLALGELRARRAERRAESAKQSLLAVAGHELRTPLTVVRGLGQTLVGRWDQLPEHSRYQMLRMIERQSRVLDHLVERLLYAAQLESDSGTMVSPRPIDVARTIRRAVEDHGALAPAHEVRADVEDPLTATADPKALDQVLFHLLDNAVRYSPSGGAVTVTARRAGRKVEIAVEDEGVGLPADVGAIFDRFVQGETVTTRTVDEGGVGLGLHIVRTLVELMDGRVRAEPRRPEGARFVVTLPASEPL